MKVKIITPNGWYSDRVGDEIKVESTPVADDLGEECYLAKDWNWYWNRDVKSLIRLEDCDITDTTGSPFEDGLELGIALGKEQKHQELVGEGILQDEEEFEEDDE